MIPRSTFILTLLFLSFTILRAQDDSHEDDHDEEDH